VRVLARAGIGSRAAVYLVLAYLTLSLVVDHGHTQRADTTGVLEELARRAWGPPLVVILAAGFLFYAGWRLLQAVAGDDGVDGGTEVAKRAGWAAMALAYLVFAAQAAAILAGSGGGGSGGGQSSSRSAAAEVLGVPGGRVLLAVFGFALVATGIGLLTWAVLQRFEVFMPLRRMPAWGTVAVRAVSTFGHAVRGLVVAAVGGTFVAAAVVGSPSDGKDLDAALRAVLHHRYGPWVLALVAAGFLAFACTSAVEAAVREL
jgi:hypothetical protein